jgi:hypothetical protein
LPYWFKCLILPAAIEGLDGASGAWIRASWKHTKLVDGAAKLARPKGLDAMHAILTRACAATAIQGLDLAVAGGKPADPHLAGILSYVTTAPAGYRAVVGAQILQGVTDASHQSDYWNCVSGDCNTLRAANDWIPAGLDTLRNASGQVRLTGITMSASAPTKTI